LLLVEDALGESLPSKVILLLLEMGRDISQGRSNAESLMWRRLDGHGALGDCRSSNLNRGDSSPLASVGMDQ